MGMGKRMMGTSGNLFEIGGCANGERNENPGDVIGKKLNSKDSGSD